MQMKGGTMAYNHVLQEEKNALHDEIAEIEEKLKSSRLSPAELAELKKRAEAIRQRLRAIR
ncbi:hypothetical protein D3227_34810 [Mesorhizobium waimense]|uniref:DUF465 domain-containing protein n=2 Tax=Mesorhizobium waimense TaxID=1300307 RepID=A0A3A5K7E3_9HYPH|nr:hypothetical protein D3227_34810 [Mesorhizobium waimense]